ncbi:uncharacterized protein LOC112055859 [Bicyclus anynana]|uniref:Uncharacterized protein LOC112055859 n=1 Tax=Bicyclus anynana TaxID=110368 RepID=A0A6J1P1T4_BICAN|nr:uncharacterized protein LOC112055859 [Bicyclus anynana]
MQSLQYLFCVIFCAITVQTEPNFLITRIDDNVLKICRNATISCIVKLMEKFVDCGSSAVLVDKTDLTNSVIKSLSHKSCYSYILRSVHTHSRLQQTKVYIISTLNVRQFTSSITQLAREVGWNPKARFLITIKEFEKEQILEIFKTLLSHNIFNALFVNEDNNEITKVYSYFPFDDQKCGQVSLDIIKEEDCDYVDTIEDYYKSLEIKYKNCSIVVTASEDMVNFIFRSNQLYSYLGKNAEGIEEYMLRNIAKLENLKIEYILGGDDKRYGIILPNHTVTGVLGYLQNDNVSIAGGGFFLIRNRADLFDFIWGYNYATICLFTPAFGKENWKNVYREFSTLTWMLIVFSFFFTSTLIIVVRKYILRKEDDKLVLLIKVWGYIFGHTDYGLYQGRKTRIIILIWIWFTYFIASFYNTAYYSLLTRIDVEKMQQKPANLESFHLKPCLTDTIRTLFKYNFNEILPANRYKNCNYTQMALDSVANSNDLYALEMEYGYRLREYRYIDKEGNYKLEMTRFSGDMVFALYTKRGFPLLQKFQRYAFYHFESGILQNHLNEIFHSIHIFHQHYKSEYTNSRLTDYRIHFCVLFLGYFISTICFIMEVYKRNI